MENNINVAEILKDKSQGTKLYDYLYDREVKLDSISTVDSKTAIWCVRNESATETTHFGFSKFGTPRGHEDGLQILLPSKSMRDWTKFAWKKGDVLASNDGRKNTIFDGFTNDTYTSFKGKHSLEYNGFAEYIGDEDGLATQDYHLKKEDAAKWYISILKGRLGGKLDYAWEHLDKTDALPESVEVYEVWHSYILGHEKWLLSTTLPDGMYYEVTYNKAKNEFYLDAYKKFENRCIKND